MSESASSPGLPSLRKPVACRVCKKGCLQPVEQVETFHPPTGEVTVVQLAARCDHCATVTVLASQLEENIRRRSARQSHYGPYLLGEDIFALRRAYGLTQQAAGRIFGKGKIAFSRYEREASFPDLSTTKLLRVAMRHPQVLKDLADEVGEPVPLWPERCEDAANAAKQRAPAA